MSFGKKLSGLLGGVSSIAGMIPGIGTAVSAGADILGGVVDAVSKDGGTPGQASGPAPLGAPVEASRTQPVPRTPMATAAPPVAPSGQALAPPVTQPELFNAGNQTPLGSAPGVTDPKQQLYLQELMRNRGF